MPPCQRPPEPQPTPTPVPPPPPPPVAIPVPLPVAIQAPLPFPVAVERPAPPQAYLPIRTSDALFLRAQASIGGIQLRARARILDEVGNISATDLILSPPDDRSPSDLQKPLLNGWLLSVAVTLLAGSPRRGQCFVQVGLLTGGSTAQDLSQLLISDYLVADQYLGWPGGVLRSSLDGPGVIRAVPTANPPPGQDIVFIVPPRAHWRVLSFRFSLSTSAAVATRWVTVAHNLAGLGAVISSFLQSQSAGQTLGYQCYPGAQFQAPINTFQYGPLPFMERLNAGDRFFTFSAGLQAGDQFHTILLVVEEWIAP